jgi:hypothetical protein
MKAEDHLDGAKRVEGASVGARHGPKVYSVQAFAET